MKNMFTMNVRMSVKMEVEKIMTIQIAEIILLIKARIEQLSVSSGKRKVD